MSRALFRRPLLVLGVLGLLLAGCMSEVKYKDREVYNKAQTAEISANDLYSHVIRNTTTIIAMNIIIKTMKTIAHPV